MAMGGMPGSIPKNECQELVLLTRLPVVGAWIILPMLPGMLVAGILIILDLRDSLLEFGV